MSDPATLEHLPMHIGGRSVEAISGERFESINPTTGEAWATLPAADERDVDAAVAGARSAGIDGPWADFTAAERGRVLLRLADVVEDNATELAQSETRDNGKLLRETLAQTKGLATWLRFFGGLADKVSGDVVSSEFPTVFNYTLREPLGVIAALVPSNSPLALSGWKIAPALAAGNTVVLKPNEIASVSVARFAELTTEAGLPPGVFNVVTGLGAACAAPLVAHPDVDHVTFTGGAPTAVRIGRATAERITPTTFELGGKSANVVFEDARLDAAVAGVLAGVFGAAGQSCIAGSRLLVHHSLHDPLVEALVHRAEAIRLGDPLEEGTQMGPLASAAYVDRVDEMVERARAAGAVVACGGSRAESPGIPSGFGYRPTILIGVKPQMEIAQEEVFGPVLSVLPFADEDEAVAIANGTPYSLAAGVWTEQLSRAHRMARRLRVGTVWVNTYRVATPMSPFGGSGKSGYGRENGLEALCAFSAPKSVLVELGDQVRDPFVVRMASTGKDG